MQHIHEGSMTAECILLPYLRLRFIHDTESKAYHMKLIQQQNDKMFFICILYKRSVSFNYRLKTYKTFKCYKNNLFSCFKTAVLYYYDFFIIS